MTTPSPGRGQEAAGLALLLTTCLGWGMNWPAMKLLLAELPVLSARSAAGMLGVASLAALALARRENLAVPRAVWPRLILASLLNVSAWMGLASFSLLWLPAAEATIVCYTMPVWAVLTAWVLLGERPGAARLAGLGLALSGLVFMMLGRGAEVGLAKLPGVGFALAAAMLFSIGTVTTKRWPIGLPPGASTVWQVAIGLVPLVVVALLTESPDFAALSGRGWLLLGYGGVMALGLCYLAWFQALRRLPASVASIGSLVTPAVGATSSALLLGEAFGWREVVTLALILSGVALAIRR